MLPGSTVFGVVRTRPRAIPLPIITMRKSIVGFLFPYMFMGLHLAAPPAAGASLLGSLSTRVFETRMANGREHFSCLESIISQILILLVSNGEKILSNVNVVV